MESVSELMFASATQGTVGMEVDVPMAANRFLPQTH